MTDQTPKPAGGAVEGNQQPQLVIELQGQYIKDLSFENPGALKAISGEAQNPQLQVNVNVTGDKLGEGQYECVLSLNAEAKTGDNVQYILELAYAGVIKVHGPEQQHAPAVLIEGPRLLFPFAREILASTTRNGGYMPLMLNPIDFVGLYRQKMAQVQAQQQAAAGQPAGNA